MIKEEMAALAQSVTMKEKSRAQMVHLFPQLAKMDAEALRALGFKPEAVQLAVAEAAEAAKASMHGISANVSMTGWHVVAKKAIERFYAMLAPLGAFSTTFAEDYVLQGAPNALPELEVGIYDDSGEAAVDNYANYDSRDSGKATSATIKLHKVDDSVTIYARNIQQGINPEMMIEALISRVAKRVLKFILEGLAVGTAQADDSTKTVAAITVPAIGNGDGEFNFGYANQELSEAVQPRVHGMLVDSAHYGALKAANRDSLTAADLDVDVVAKVQDTTALGAKAVGVIANRRGAAVGIAAPYFIPAAYDSVEQMQHKGLGCPLTIATYYLPGINAIKVVVACMVGVSVTDASAIKVLQTA